MEVCAFSNISSTLREVRSYRYPLHYVGCHAMEEEVSIASKEKTTTPQYFFVVALPIMLAYVAKKQLYIYSCGCQETTMIRTL